MIDFVLWYLMLLLLGWLAFPITFRVFPKLKDRGFGLSKIAGLLVWGYVFWLSNMLGFNRNTVAGLLLALAIVALCSGLLLRNGRRAECWGWLRAHWRMALFSELVFLFLFALWAFIRATSPDVLGTEKPMEMAFISSILRSDTFPPRDPWLSGYAISYYYFGYVMIAMLIKLAGTAPWVGFNLAGALWFALTGSAAFSVVYNLVSGLLERNGENGNADRANHLGWGLLGPLFVLIVSNAEGFLEMLHSRGLFWRTGADGSAVSTFWNWLDIRELVSAPTAPYSWTPERPGGIWWWRASRVLQDYAASGEWREVIDEFPFFSYYLADLHPHVLAMPFVLLAIAFAYHFFLQYQPASEAGMSLGDWLMARLQGIKIPLQTLTIYPLLSSASFWVMAFVTGSLAFLNTWDFPIYVGLMGAVYAFHRYRVMGWGWSRLIEFITFALLTVLAGVLFFLPFYFGFSSQAGGFLPSLSFFTRGIHFWVMFLPLLFPLGWWIFTRVRADNRRVVLRNGVRFSLLVVGGLAVLSYLLGWLGALMPVIGSGLQSGAAVDSFGARLGQRLIEWGSLFYNLQGLSQPSQVWATLAQRLTQPGTWLTLGLLILLVWGLLSLHRKSDSEAGPVLPGAQAFVLMMVLLGLGLAVFPEFFYLRDQFGYRINTIFKFYFQTWILWAVAAAAASALLWKSVRVWVKPVFGVLWIAILLVCMAYPWYGISSRLNGLDWKSLSLNGARYLEIYAPGDMEAIQWLLTAQDGVIVEAVGVSYSGYARIATFSGMQNVLGWPGHESQWRGGYEEMGSREEDIRQIYQSNNWEETLGLLHKYSVNYVYVGSMELNTYHVNENKFANNLGIAYQNDTVRVYEVTADVFQPAE